MNRRLATVSGQLRQLEAMHERVAALTANVRARQPSLVLPIHRYLARSRFLVIVTAPVIWLCLIPIALLDLLGSIYQAVWFPIYGIPKVGRHEYLVFDRRPLTYLNGIEKLNCAYCSYANGILAYFTEIAARAEQHWCPIKHAQPVKTAHGRYDSEKTCRSYADIEQGIVESKSLPVDRELRPSAPIISYTGVFLVIAILGALLGFVVLAGNLAIVAQLTFFVFTILTLFSFVLGPIPNA